MEQEGFPVATPFELFQSLTPILVLSLDMQIAKNASNQCPPRYEALQDFEYKYEVHGENYRGFTGYCRWMREQILRLGSPKDISNSLQELKGMCSMNHSYDFFISFSSLTLHVLIIALPFFFVSE